MAKGQVLVGDLLDLVGAVGEKPDAVDSAVRHLYDWHNGRSVAGMQLTFAPAAGAVVGLAAKPESATVTIVVICVAVIAVAVGIGLLFQLNSLHGEYALAVRLAVALAAFYPELAKYPHGVGAPPRSPAGLLYGELSKVSMVKYRDDSSCREAVLRTLGECEAIRMSGHAPAVGRRPVVDEGRRGLLTRLRARL